MPSGTAIKPGDIITQYNGRTVEVNNTDAEGRLILADALAYAVELGAERIVDLATLTGAVVIALGSTYAAVISNDDELAAAVAVAGETSGELTWRLPLHPEFKAMMKGTLACVTTGAIAMADGENTMPRSRSTLSRVMSSVATVLAFAPDGGPSSRLMSSTVCGAMSLL